MKQPESTSIPEQSDSRFGQVAEFVLTFSLPEIYYRRLRGAIPYNATSEEILQSKLHDSRSPTRRDLTELGLVTLVFAAKLETVCNVGLRRNSIFVRGLETLDRALERFAVGAENSGRPHVSKGTCCRPRECSGIEPVIRRRCHRRPEEFARWLAMLNARSDPRSRIASPERILKIGESANRMR